MNCNGIQCETCGAPIGIPCRGASPCARRITQAAFLSLGVVVGDVPSPEERTRGEPGKAPPLVCEDVDAPMRKEKN